jgi:hypothetical protein
VKYVLRDLRMQAALGNVDAAKKKKKRRKVEKNEDENKNLKGTKKNQLSPMPLSAFLDNNQTPVPTRRRSYILRQLSRRIKARLTLPLRIDPVEPYSLVELSLVPYLELLSVFRLHVRLISLKCYQ